MIGIDMMTRDDMINELRTRPCRVIFRKVNGEERDMMCTLNEEYMPENSVDTNSDKQSRGYSDDTIRVIDINKGEWRSFRIDSVISFS
jgi:hypothetical protein